MKLSFRRKKDIIRLPKVTNISNIDQDNSYVVVQLPSKGANAGIEAKIKLSDFGKSEAMAEHLKKVEIRIADLVATNMRQDKEIDTLQKQVDALEPPKREIPKKEAVVKKKTKKK